MQNWGHGVIIIPLCGVIACLGHWERCPYPSGKLADISLVGDILTCLACHATQTEAWLKGGPGVVPPSALGRGASPSRKLSNWGSREGGHLRSPASGWDQSDGSTLSATSGQDSGGESSDGAWGTSFTLVSSSELDSLKVTFLVGWVGLGDGTHLLQASLGGPPLRGSALVGYLPSTSCNSSFAFYFLNTSNCLLASAAGPPMSDGMAQSLNVALQQGGCHQHLMVGIPCYLQGLLT